jgi:pimeloyl-ACP methyl ester carboxylesterase
VPELTTAGCRLHYEDAGTGPPLVLVHGASTSSVWWEELSASLASEFRVIAPDLRGMGRSDRVDEMAADAWNDDLMALVDHLELETFHLAGTSLGARVALRAALSATERVLSVTLDAVILFDTDEGTAAIEQLFGGELPPDVEARTNHANGPDWRQVLDNYLRLRRTPGLQDLYDFRGELGSLRCPAFVCRGDIDDAIHPLAHSVQAHAEIPDSRLWVAPGTPFSALHFRAGDAAGRVLDFLRDRAADGVV